MLFSVKPQHESAIGVHVFPPFWTSLPSPSPSHSSRLMQSPCLSFLSHTANSYWLCILLFLKILFKILAALCGMWDFSCPIRGWIWTLCIGRQSLRHWTITEIQNKLLLRLTFFLKKRLFLIGRWLLYSMLCWFLPYNCVNQP